jgi:hypothetical protein
MLMEAHVRQDDDAAGRAARVKYDYADPLRSYLDISCNEVAA